MVDWIEIRSATNNHQLERSARIHGRSTVSTTLYRGYGRSVYDTPNVAFRLRVQIGRLIIVRSNVMDIEL